MSFSEVLDYILHTADGKARRNCWGGHYYITRRVVKEFTYIRLCSKDTEICFTPSQNDMVSNDWELC